MLFKVRQQIVSLIVWMGISLLILCWLPLLAIIRLFDRDPVRYQTGRMFRRLGWAISRINPNWKITVEGFEKIDDRLPYVIVCNHLSNADIPLISNLPWEMKWVAKKELFKIPVVGWMMQLAQDISVDRRMNTQKIAAFKKCLYYLNHQCSVIFFPEGTRSRDGEVKAFNRGAFDLAIRSGTPVLPLVLDGTQDCLPKHTWVFKPDVRVRLAVLEPVQVDGYTPSDAEKLSDEVRSRIMQQLYEWRG